VSGNAPDPISYASCTAVTIQADGKILVAGLSAFGPSYYYWLSRYNTDGSSDPTFIASVPPSNYAIINTTLIARCDH